MTGLGGDPIRVVVIDDHQVVREGLRAMLDGLPQVAIVGEAEGAAAGLAAVARLQPEVVLLDLRLQGGSGLEVCRTIVDRHPQTKVVFLTVYDDEQYVFEAFRAGASGYLLKKAAPEDIVRFLEAVRRGEVVVDPSLGGQMAMRAAAARRGELWPGAELGLTRREGEVLACLVRGLSNHEIAEALVISPETAKTHVRAIFRKLGVRDRAQAVALALRSGLVS
jgi:DNA-binding NarL/FixJ family response regulator